MTGGRRFQDEAARWENTRRDEDRRNAGGSSNPANVARVVRCEMMHANVHWTNPVQL